MFDSVACAYPMSLLCVCCESHAPIGSACGGVVYTLAPCLSNFDYNDFVIKKGRFGLLCRALFDKLTDIAGNARKNRTGRMNDNETPSQALAEMLDIIALSLRHSGTADTLDKALEALHGINARGYYARQVEKLRDQENAQEDN